MIWTGISGFYYLINLNLISIMPLKELKDFYVFIYGETSGS